MIGTVLSGSIGGMLLAPTFSGALGEWLGWRHPYLVAAALVLLPAGLWALLPSGEPSLQPRRRPGAATRLRNAGVPGPTTTTPGYIGA
ncbi:hypothetical protein [Streptomyces sp. NBC_00316]|uniref:hypothetical protein n=1 Tax=Streptomyces sp. NBC_00316 TaxID=2975710 RepID=UPI002E28FFAE|nr:hypothetical protein [Streptomyces sp. NBC_00316]